MTEIRDLAGKVVFISGVARGQGRNHAVRFAERGARVIGFDICADLSSVKYPLATREDLEETARLIKDAGSESVLEVADSRDFEAVNVVAQHGLEQFGGIDTVVANAGICTLGPTWELSAETWAQMIDVNLTGVFNTVKSAIPGMISASKGGSIVITSSIAGLKGMQNMGHYCASKHGVVGLMRTLASELAEHRIRVNTVNPTNVDTPMIHNDAVYSLFRPDLEHPNRDQAAESMIQMNALPIPWVDVDDISAAVVWLASDSARYVTGSSIPVDAGYLTK